ncbi:MAG: hypothetical protein M3Q10_20825 [Chloroflexota bacterium]|nr:hypothetical protein [Chloroflexota bacterium]
MGGFAVISGGAFVWRHERAEVTLAPAGDGWSVVYRSTTRLLGPRQVFYEKEHRDPTYAAWDVMARVVLATRDEEEGLRAGRSAAQWLRGRSRPPLDNAADTSAPADA